MAVFKCKMCGGALEVQSGTTVVSCEYCGTKQTLPRLDDERKANLYDRAGHFRRNNEFDKAMGIYEQILNEDSTDAESYWSLILCRYGIEYVEDPATRKRIPTVNRTQYTSVFDDEDYKSALQCADNEQRKLYEAEAAVINDIQKNILAISQKETPFDVFICYKETDANGRRTPDSVLATELYHELTREGYKVFFSCITLEDKLGQEYEPYIFAALNSAKVMVVLGTKPEHFNAVWVKNEWSRYLALIKNGARKTLIPAYRDMDPYDLPEEFSHLQALDMAKLGFVQDLIRGIGKLAVSGTAVADPRRETAAQPVDEDVRTVLQRGFLSLENGEWGRADDFFERVLNNDLENAEAYLGKLMAWAKVRNRDELPRCRRRLEKNGNYRLAMRFGDGEMTAFLEDISAQQAKRRQKQVNWSKVLLSFLLWLFSASLGDVNEVASVTVSFFPYIMLGLEFCIFKKRKWMFLAETRRLNFILLWINLCVTACVLCQATFDTDRSDIPMKAFHIFIIFLIVAELFPLVCWMLYRKKVLKTVLCTIASVILLGLNIFFFYVSPVIYHIENGTATVLGVRNHAIEEVTIPETYFGNPVTKIEGLAFNGEEIKKVTIPGSIKVIGDWAFSNNSELESIVFEEGATVVGEYMFQECYSLESVLLPSSITHIGDGAFSVCTSLKSITIPSGVTTIGYHALSECTGLTTLNLSEGLKKISESSFKKCTALSNVIIPSSVTDIGVSAFEGCFGLENVTFKQTKGWTCENYELSLDVISGKVDASQAAPKHISNTALKNPATAAEYLTETYVDEFWTRE